MNDPIRHRVAIDYCTGCNWLLRAGWMAQELLSSLSDHLEEVALRPGSGGVFRVTVNDQVVWDRTVDEGFPPIAELKRRVRDRVAPDWDLGHLDRA